MSSEQSTSLALKVLGSIMPDVDSCRAKAQGLAAEFPGMTKHQLAARAVKKAKLICATVGGGTGLVGNPLAAVPAAAADVAMTLKSEAYMIGVIAAIFDPDTLNNPDDFQADVLSILFPSAAAQTLSGFAVRAGQATTRTLIRRYINKDVLKALVKFAAKYLGLKLTQKALLTKAVPLIGGLIGAAWNWVEVQNTGKRAVAYYSDQSEYREP